MKLSEAFDSYMNSRIVARGGSPNTFEQYRYAKKIALQFFGDTRVTKLEPKLIEEFYLTMVRTKQLNGRKHDPDTARGYICCLRAVFSMLRSRGYRVLDPKEVALPKRQKKEPHFLTRFEVEKLAETALMPKRGYPKVNRYRNELIIRLLFCSGIRVSELVALNRDSIRDRQFVVVGKSKDPRVCYITEDVELLIDNYLAMRNDCDNALFVSDQTGGQRISAKTVQMVFRRISQESGIDVHPHTLRHSFATLMVQRNVDLLDVSKMLGHQSLDTTKIYTHIANPRLFEIHQRVMAF